MPDFNHPYVGRVVVYDGRHGSQRQQGVVTSVNEHYVFARFGSGSTSAACSPGSLAFLDGTQPDLITNPPAVGGEPEHNTSNRGE